MTERKSSQELSDAVEALIRNYGSQAHIAVLEGLARGLVTTRDGPSSSGASPCSCPSSSCGPTPPRKRKVSPKRSPELLAKMTDELYQCIVNSPGESMAAFAATLGYTALELQVPVATLEKAKRVRTTGDRRQLEMPVGDN